MKVIKQLDRHNEERKPKAILDEQDLKQTSTIETQESIEETPLEVSDDEDEENKPDEQQQQAENIVEEPISNPPVSSSSEDDDEDESSAYPDTQVTYSEELPVKSNQRKESKTQEKPIIKSNNENQPLKRGQRARLKKIKEKYKDQDEEDRQVRMQLLGSAGTQSKKKQQEQQKQQQQQQKTQNKNNKKKNESAPPRPQSGAAAVIDEDEVEQQQEDEEEKAKRLSEDARLLSTLTGQPTIEDPLINVIGVCAPWVTLNNYKYKVKILPGGLGKKGKNVQAALKLFAMDRTASQLEKDLIKTVKDQEVTRNLPSGKVKFVLPSYIKFK